MSLIKDVVIYNEETMPLYNENLTISCHDKFGLPLFFVPPGPYNNIIILKYLDPLALIIIIIISEIILYGPPCMLSTIAEIQKGQGLDSGYKWLAGIVSRSAWGSEYFGVQISCDSPQ